MNNLPRRDEPGWYYRLSSFFREKFGHPVYKIPLDAGFSCPNRDGTIGNGGCTYCYNPSFAPFSGKKQKMSIAEQLAAGKKKSKKAFYIAYFQSYTNTYAPAAELKKIYDQALMDKDVIGLSIATRPDCVPDEILDLLEDYAHRLHLLWIEYGLQSAHDSTLKRINRGHDASAFADAVLRTMGRGIYTCAHIILGLPGETEEMMYDTIAFLNRCRVNGVKFHHLQVIRHTPLANEYEKGKVAVFENAKAYVPLLCNCLERLSPDIVVQRLAGQVAEKEMLIAPGWPESPGQIAAMTLEELRKRSTCQGHLSGTRAGK
ncbi:MAG: TIGR01212 family radical SAM protein [Bacillota bacterium]|nr:TIGR01212 family radical SAM protein [Bacillota bacterium]